jgi:Tfp pilus assembly protein PilO
LADQRNIQINKLSDSNKFSLPGLIETTYTLELEASYVQIGQFISDLESLDNILKIHALDISPTQVSDKEVTAPGAPNRYRMTIEFSVFKVKKEV